MRSPIVTAVHETRRIPGRPFGRSTTLLLLLGFLGLPAVGAAGTGRLLSQWMSRAPRIDGRIEAAEWAAAKRVDLGSGVTVRIGNDQRTLYLAVLDAGNATYDSSAADEVRLYFDDEGGVPPVLDDGTFGASACQQAPNLGEGEIGLFQYVYFTEITQTGSCPSMFRISDRVSYRAATQQEGVSYEAAIPLDGQSPLRAGPGQRFGIRLRVLRDDSEVACLPNCAAISPPDFQNLILASGGCNSGPQTFGSGDPLTSLPLDWTSELSTGTGQSWVQTRPPFYGDPVFCDANETGGTGAAACVANYFHTSSRADARLLMPLSLVGQTSVMVRLRAVLTVDPNVYGQYEYLSVDLRRQDGTGSNTAFFWLGQNQQGVAALWLPLAGSPPVELWFTHSTFANGGVEGGYAQIDDVELLCDPLHTDDFEDGLVARWSAVTP